MRVRLTDPVIDLPDDVARRLIREGKATAAGHDAAVAGPLRNAAARTGKPTPRKAVRA